MSEKAIRIGKMTSLCGVLCVVLYKLFSGAGPQNVVELISLAFTLPTLILAYYVIREWGPTALADARSGRMSSGSWLKMGIVTGFIGAFADNLYWMVPWTAKFLSWDCAADLVDAGVYFNVISRQGLGIAAAYCHIRASQEAPNKPAGVAVDANLILFKANIAASVAVVFFSCLA